MSEIPTLAVPAALYDEALAFCNARLAEKGKPAIDALPAGMARDPLSCPCGVACGGSVAVSHAGMWWRVNPVDQFPLRRDGPARFTTYFDSQAPGGTPTLPVRDATLPVPS